MTTDATKALTKIALGISGSIAAYKSLYLARLLDEAGYHVTPLLTRSARQFVTPLSLSVLTGNRAITNLWTASEVGADVSHVELAHAIEALVIAPATADLLLRLARGEASDPVSSIALTTSAKRLIAPAMEPAMWNASSTQDALAVLRDNGWQVIGPQSGFLASGRSGIGRMSEPDSLFEAIETALTPKDLLDKRIVVTAGPTREHLDPARYLSNPSSGKMGLALAKQAANRGANVTLIHGPISQPIPANLGQTIAVGTTEDLLAACEAALKDSPDALVMAAAPADYRPQSPSKEKAKKKAGTPVTFELEANPDILKTTKKLRRNVITVGFAAESHDLERFATQKLKNKGLDFIVGNYIGRPDTGFSSDTNEVWIYSMDGTPKHIPLSNKTEIANAILNCLAEKLPTD
jgi:phosphopantothenoylcysteine decarboxylase/phosphopantothenate--cysteine ligase